MDVVLKYTIYINLGSSVPDEAMVITQQLEDMTVSTNKPIPNAISGTSGK